MIECLKKQILHDLRAVVKPVVFNKTGQAVRISQILDRGTLFEKVASYVPLLDGLEDLLGHNIEVVKNRHNHATLNLATGQDAVFHRDLMQWSRGLVSVIFFLEDAHLDNGCTQIIPGSHMLPEVEDMHHVDAASWIEKSGVLEQAVPVPMEAGGILILDGYVFHRLGRNRTTDSRMSLTFGYHSVDELYAGEDDKRWLVRGTRCYMGNDRF